MISDKVPVKSGKGRRKKISFDSEPVVPEDIDAPYRTNPNVNKLTTRKELIQRIAKKSGYFQHEVEDVYDAINAVYVDLMLDLRSFTIPYVCTVEYKESKVREFFNPRTQTKTPSVGGLRVRLKESKRMTRIVKNVSLGRVTPAEVLALSNEE